MRRFAALLGLLLLLGACGDDASTSTPPSEAPSAAPTVAAPTTGAVPTTAAASPSPPKPVFSAADGRNLTACADNTCEVIVRSGDVLRVRGDIGPLHVQVSGGLVTLSQTAASGFSSTVTGSVGARQQINNQVIFVVAVEGTSAVLRLQPA